MFNVKHKSHESLVWTRNDCRSAIMANPDNPKVDEYLRLMREIDRELDLRERKVVMRRGLSMLPGDPYSLCSCRARCKQRGRTWGKPGSYEFSCFVSACYTLLGLRSQS